MIPNNKSKLYNTQGKLIKEAIKAGLDNKAIIAKLNCPARKINYHRRALVTIKSAANIFADKLDNYNATYFANITKEQFLKKHLGKSTIPICSISGEPIDLNIDNYRVGRDKIYGPFLYLVKYMAFIKGDCPLKDYFDKAKNAIANRS